MQNSNLVQLIESLSKKDLRELSKFLRSPFHNQRKDVIILFDGIVNALTKNRAALQRDKLFHLLFPNQNYEEQQLRHIMSYLMKLIKNYLVIAAFQKEEMEQKLFLLAAVEQKSNLQISHQVWKNLEKHLQNSQYQNGIFFQKKHDAALEYLKAGFGEKNKEKQMLQMAFESLNIGFICQLLRLGCRMLSERSLNFVEYETHLLEQVLVFLEKEHFREIPAVQLYYYSYLTLSEKNKNKENAFRHLKELIGKYASLLPQEEALDLYLILINFCIRKTNRGHTDFAAEALEFYQQALDNGILLEKGYLTVANYSNIFKLGLKLQQLAWAKNFLERYKTKLHPKHQINYYHYNLAIFYYWKKEYELAMSMLHKVHFKEEVENLTLRRMLVRIYFETEEWEALYSLLKSFRAYINRHKSLSRQHQLLNKNLISMVAKMSKSDLTNKEVREKLKAEIERLEWIAEKKWLVEQLR